MRFNDLRVTTRLWVGIFGLLLAMLAVSVWTQRTSETVALQAQEHVNRAQERILQATRWRANVELANTFILGRAVTTDAALVKSYDAKVAALVDVIDGLVKNIQETSIEEADKQQLAAIFKLTDEILAAIKKSAEIKATGDQAAVQRHVDQVFLPAAALYLNKLQDFVNLQEQHRNDAMKQAEDVQQTAQVRSWISSAVLLVLAAGLALSLVRSIVLPLERAVAFAGAIAAGDLSQDIQENRKDEFGNLLRSLSVMVVKLRGVVSEVRQGVDSVSSASIEIANGNHDLSARTEQTAANLEETASSMEELTATVTQSADTARQANQLAGTAAQAAARGGEVVGQVVTSMQQITESSRKISDIIGVIDGIAFQTNILALNAAVEAARAGEQGRGFAVVASEVRSLAGRSAEAAKEIKTLIGKSVENVESGSEQVAQAGKTMDEIVASVRRVSDLIGEITASSTEQRDGIAQVNQAVANLDQMTQQNAALVEESTAAAASMRDQAQRLAEVVAVFNVGGSTRAAAPAPRPAAQAAPAARLAPSPAPAPARAAVRAAVASSPKAAPAAKLAHSAPAKAAAPAPAAAKGNDDEWESF